METMLEIDFEHHECSSKCMIECDVCKKVQCIELTEKEYLPKRNGQIGHVCIECIMKDNDFLPDIKK